MTDRQKCWWLLHREELRAKRIAVTRKWQRDNPEAVKKHRKTYYWKNREAIIVKNELGVSIAEARRLLKEADERKRCRKTAHNISMIDGCGNASA